MNSSAEDLTDCKSAKSNLRKYASFPVCSFSSAMAVFAFSSLRTAMYTFALCASSACMFYNNMRNHGLVGIGKNLPLSFLSQSLFENRVYFHQYYLRFAENMILQRTCIPAGNDDDLSGQIRDVVYAELAPGRKGL